MKNLCGGGGAYPVFSFPDAEKEKEEKEDGNDKNKCNSDSNPNSSTPGKSRVYGFLVLIRFCFDLIPCFCFVTDAADLIALHLRMLGSNKITRTTETPTPTGNCLFKFHMD